MPLNHAWAGTGSSGKTASCWLEHGRQDPQQDSQLPWTTDSRDPDCYRKVRHRSDTTESSSIPPTRINHEGYVSMQRHVKCPPHTHTHMIIRWLKMKINRKLLEETNERVFLSFLKVKSVIKKTNQLLQKGFYANFKFINSLFSLSRWDFDQQL